MRKEMTAEQRAQVDEDWPEHSTEVAKQDAPREVTLHSPSGVITTATVADLKQLDFATFAEQGLVTAEDALGGDQWGPILETTGKQRLVGKPFIIVWWQFSKGDVGEFVSAFVITEDNERLIMNDGSTGVYTQLRNHTDRTGSNSGMAVPYGLRRSEYDTTLANGREVHGVTYYLETSKRVS